MWFRLKNADFSNDPDPSKPPKNLGTMSQLSGSYFITWNVTGGIAKTNCPTLVQFDQDTKLASLTATLTLAEGAELSGTPSSTSGTLTRTVSGTTVTITITGIDKNCTVTIAATSGYVEPETPVTPTNYIFTITPDPTSATVTLSATGYSTVSGTGSKSITVANGTKVNWRVEASGYTAREGSWTISGGNKTENITLSASDGSIANLYNAAKYPVANCTYSVTPGVNSSNTKVVEVKRGSTTSAYGMEIYQFPVEAGKTYSIKLYNAPTTATTVGYDTDNDGTLENMSEISYFGLYGVVFYETIDGIPSIRYTHTNTGTNNTHFTSWNTSKQPTYTGDLEISSSSTPGVFSISQGYNSDKVVITNLATGTKTSDVASSIFGPDTNLFTQSVQITINDGAITHMTLLWGNPSDSLYQMGRVSGSTTRIGVLSAEDQAAAYETLENGLVIVEGSALPESYIPYVE